MTDFFILACLCRFNPFTTEARFYDMIVIKRLL